ncbi:MAG: ATP-binding protein [Cyanobacteria bacterium P01_F01_bin.150]
MGYSNIDMHHSNDLPNTIQPHGLLLALDETDFSILQVSTNAEEYLDIPYQQLLGMSLDNLFDLSQIPTLLQQILLVQEQVIPIKLSYPTTSDVIRFDGFMHRAGPTIILELEPSLQNKIYQSNTENVLVVNAFVRESLREIRQAETHLDLLNVMVQKVRSLTEYDRVLIYQFDDQGNGCVKAEAHRPDLPSYLGLHFPDIDIPQWVRAFYSRGKTRAIPNMQAPAIALFPEENPTTGVPLDLGSSVLRSPDACCVEYYGNMDMNSTFIVSLMNHQTLWGLLACHHSTPAYLSYDIRASCELLAQVATSDLISRLKQQDLEQRTQLHTLRSELIAAIAQADNFIDALVKPKDKLLNLVNASGAVICLGDSLTFIGITPSQDQVQALIRWIDSNLQDTLFHTHCLSDVYPDALEFKELASGLLVLRISAVQHYLITWFRPEVIQTVDWGGDPTAAMQVDEQGGTRLGPRSSFERWQQKVYGSSLPWQPYEISGADDLRQAIVGIVLKKADELAELNRELQRSNRELTSFAYAAAHDLKEPLRGIYNYANILQEDYGKHLDEDGLDYLTEIQGFAQRMETLINALLRISQLRQTSLKIEPANLNELLEQTIEVLYASQPTLTFDVQISQTLPTIQCDPVLVSEVFRNLISNGIKYNEQSSKVIEIGYSTDQCRVDTQSDSNVRDSLIFYVRDNGIGIRDDHIPLVFKLFKRLYPQDCYGGGAGVGLAVVTQIVERHGGCIWVESVLGEGSTFYFTLEPPTVE